MDTGVKSMSEGIWSTFATSKNTKKPRLRHEGAVRFGRGSRTTTAPSKKLLTVKDIAMAKIKSTKQFKQEVDAAFTTMQTRDEAKACYEFERDEYKNAEKELCAYAGEHPEVFDGHDGTSGWGATDTVEYTVSSGRSVERADGGRVNDAEFLKGIPRKYVRVKMELNKAKIKADGLDEEELAQLGLVSVATSQIKLSRRNAA